MQSYSIESVPNEPKEGIPLKSYAVDRNDIPLNKDWSKRKCTFSATFEKYIDRMINFKSREDDVWIVTMPKCGTTWMQEAAWLVQHDFDFETAKSVLLTERSPFVESVYKKVFSRKVNIFKIFTDSKECLKVLPHSKLPTMLRLQDY